MNLNESLQASIQLERMKKANETPKLEDFSTEAISFAYVAIKKAREEALDHIAKLRGMGFEMDNARLAYWMTEAETATLWITQLFNAQKVINKRDETLSN